MRFSLPTAIHAGHAVAWLSMGFPVERVDVYVRHGGKRVLGSRLQGRCRVGEHTSTIRQEVTVLYAGPLAEARHTRRWAVGCVLAGDAEGGDFWEIQRLLARLSKADQEQVHRECKAAAREIIRDRWPDVVSLARVLSRDGNVLAPKLSWNGRSPV
jgi:hypothetical protein